MKGMENSVGVPLRPAHMKLKHLRLEESRGVLIDQVSIWYLNVMWVKYMGKLCREWERRRGEMAPYLFVSVVGVLEDGTMKERALFIHWEMSWYCPCP